MNLAIFVWFYSTLMPEILNDRNAFSLSEVTESIRKTLANRYTTAFWVKAEMIRLNHYAYSGHCYPDLVEKQEGKLVAQIRSHLWNEDYLRANRQFHQVVNEPLRDGIKILFLARIAFDPVHGLSLRIIDIDPQYTLGDMEKERQETIKRLKTEGLFGLNRSLPLPLLPKRIAVISVETSKGFADFKQVIANNPFGYKFFWRLYPSVLQGEKAVESIIMQLRRIAQVQQFFDVVAVIRGGGGDVGLSAFNDYRLAREVACFPIPVFTGIGHATNETVTEMVACHNAITPTKLAGFLLERFHQYAQPVEAAVKVIKEGSEMLLAVQKSRLQNEARLFRAVANKELGDYRYRLRQLPLRLQGMLHQTFTRRRNIILNVQSVVGAKTLIQLRQNNDNLKRRSNQLAAGVVMKLRNSCIDLDHVNRNVENMSPANVLKRGFSITRLNGKAITDPATLKSNDIIETTVYCGTISSIVQQTAISPKNKR